jgi:hypothetical protein
MLLMSLQIPSCIIASLQPPVIDGQFFSKIKLQKKQNKNSVFLEKKEEEKKGQYQVQWHFVQRKVKSLVFFCIPSKQLI